MNISILIKSLIVIVCFFNLAVVAKGKTTVESCNRIVTFEEPPKKAISNDVNLTEMMLVLGILMKILGKG